MNAASLPHPSAKQSQHQAHSGAAACRLVLAKQNYNVGQSLQFYVAVQNMGRNPFLIESSFIPRWHIFINIFDVSGKNVEFPNPKMGGYYPAPLKKADFVNLAPNFLYGRDLSRDYPVKLLRPGKYYIQAFLHIYDHSDRLGFKAWSGSIRSTRVPITVNRVPKSQK